MMAAVARFGILLLTVVGTATQVVAAERELGAHRHGHGTVNMAIEGSTVWIELEAPGADIVGFERAAETAQETAAVEAGRKLLESPLQLFSLSPGAGCSVDSAAVTIAGLRGDGMSAHDSSDEREGTGGNGHAEFEGEYRFACAAPERLVEIRFPYFSHFPAARELEVNVITTARQSRYEVERERPVIRLRDD